MLDSKIYGYIYIYIERERERLREHGTQSEHHLRQVVPLLLALSDDFGLKLHCHIMF